MCTPGGGRAGLKAVAGEGQEHFPWSSALGWSITFGIFPLQVVDVSHCSQLRLFQLPALQEQLEQQPPPMVDTGAAAAAPPVTPPLVSLPKLSTLYAEGNLPPEIILRIRSIKAARRAVAAAALEGEARIGP